MLGQLRENQLVLMLAHPQLAIESPESESQPALWTPMRSRRPRQPTTNFDKKYDTEFLRTYGLPSANEFPNMAKDELELINQNVTKTQKSVGGRKSSARTVEVKDNLDGYLAKLKEYKKILDATMSTELSEIIGNGFGHQRKINA